MFFVGAATKVANLVRPAAGKHLLFASVLAVALFISAPPGVFIDQNSFD